MSGPAIRDRRAFAAGLLFIAIAILFFLLSAGLDRGSAARMGPGYFPTALSLVLGAIGLAVAAGALRRAAPVRVLAPWNWRPLGWISGSVVLFAVLVGPAGFVAALAAMVVVASRGGGGSTWRGALITAAVLAAISIVVFDGLVDLRLPLWPGWRV